MKSSSPLLPASSRSTRLPWRLPEPVVFSALPRRVESSKLAGYLLNVDHPIGGPKATFFIAFGFSASAPEVLEAALLALVDDGVVIRTESTAFGEKYVVDGALQAPDGRKPRLRSIWFARAGVLRLVTAYPA